MKQIDQIQKSEKTKQKKPRPNLTVQEGRLWPDLDQHDKSF